MLWALEDRGSGTLVGYCGFAPTNAACLRPDLIEIGWALDRHRWGEGLATEAAVGVMPVGLDLFGPGRIVAKCHIDNSASERVMRRVGLRRGDAASEGGGGEGAHAEGSPKECPPGETNGSTNPNGLTTVDYTSGNIHAF